MSHNGKLTVLEADQLDFIKQCIVKSAPGVVNILEKFHGRKGRGTKNKETNEGTRKRRVVKSKSAKVNSFDDVSEKGRKRKKKVAKFARILDSDSEEDNIMKRMNKSTDSDDEEVKRENIDDKRKEIERKAKEELKRKEIEEKEAEKQRMKEERRRIKEEKQNMKVREEKNRRAEEEALRRTRKDEINVEKVVRKRKLIADSDEEERHPNIVIESETDSDKEVDSLKRSHSRSVESLLNKMKRKVEHRPTDERNRLKMKDVSGKDRKQALLEFNCITAPQLEIKELDDFLEMRDILKEYGVTEEYKAALRDFPEDEILTCDSDECPFILTYEKPFSPLYQEARKKWTSTVNSFPTSSHLRNKCVNCDKMLTQVSPEVWTKWLGPFSFYCSVKCISGKVKKVLREMPDSESITVLNAVTGQTVHAGVFKRELRSFFLLSPNWMPFNMCSSPAINELGKKKSAQKSSESVERKPMKPVTKKSAEQTENVRNTTKTSFENSLVERAGKLKMKMDVSKIREICERIEEKLFQKCDRNFSHPRYRAWKQQFISNVEQEKEKTFIVNVLTNRLTIDKLVSLEANQLRNPACWKPKYVIKKAVTTTTINESLSPLDLIMGDDTRDTTGEHMSHAFSKTCKICQAKQIADAQEKVKRENEERELRERRERNIRMMEEFRLEELKRKEEQEKKEQDEMDCGGGDDYGGDFDSPECDPDVSTFSNHRSSVEPSTSAEDEDTKWKTFFRFYYGDKKLRMSGSPIFPKTKINYELMKFMKNVVDDKGFEMNSSVNVRDFLFDSYRAMNNHRSCAIAALRVDPEDNFTQYRDILSRNIDNETVRQLENVRADDLLSVFLFPHKGNDILHDTLAPLQYNIGTSDDCFILLFILQPNFGAKFKFSVRLSDVEMREQLEEIKNQSADQRWCPSSPTGSVDRERGSDYRREVGTPKLEEVHNTPLEVDEKSEKSAGNPDTNLSNTKTMIILNIIKASVRIRDIVDSTKDFMVDDDVTKDDKAKVRLVIEERIHEEKKKRKEVKKKKNKTSEVNENENEMNGEYGCDETDFRISNDQKKEPPPLEHVNHGSNVVAQSIPPIVINPLQMPDLSLPPPNHPSGSIIAPFNPSILPPPIIHPPSIIPPPMIPPSMIPPQTVPPPMIPPAIPSSSASHMGMSEREIVADAIRKGLIAPIPDELLMGQPMQWRNEEEGTLNRADELIAPIPEELLSRHGRRWRHEEDTWNRGEERNSPIKGEFLSRHGRRRRHEEDTWKRGEERNSPITEELLPRQPRRWRDEEGDSWKREPERNSPILEEFLPMHGRRRRHEEGDQLNDLPDGSRQKLRYSVMPSTSNSAFDPLKSKQSNENSKVEQKDQEEVKQQDTEENVLPKVGGGENCIKQHIYPLKEPPHPPIFDVKNPPVPPLLPPTPPSTGPPPLETSDLLLLPPPPPPPDPNLFKNSIFVPPSSLSAASTNEDSHKIGEEVIQRNSNQLATRGRPPMIRGRIMRGMPPSGWRGGPPPRGLMNPRGMVRGGVMHPRGGPMPPRGQTMYRGNHMAPRGSPRGRGMMSPQNGSTFFQDSPRRRGGPPRGQWQGGR